MTDSEFVKVAGSSMIQLVSEMVSAPDVSRLGRQNGGQWSLTTEHLGTAGMIGGGGASVRRESIAVLRRLLDEVERGM